MGMILTWSLERYARCYSDSSKQCLDYNRKSSIFQYFAHLDTQRSQSLGNFWSAINTCEVWKLYLRLTLLENRQNELEVILTESISGNSVILEKLVFPRDFELQFKISARKESIGFRYMVENKKFLFQAFFTSEYDCHLCFDSFSRFGLLSGNWSEPFQFVKFDLIPTKTTHSKVESICQSVLTPEYSCIDLQRSEDVTKYSIPQLNEESTKVDVISNEDPDVTQLEIDINTTSISISGSQNFKKRQLIDLNENTDTPGPFKEMSGLGTKENGLFKTAIQLYEIKQYKKGLKTCEQILAKYPDHGETLALKGLFLLFLEKRDEGFETCKKGLKLSLQSHISWHILGLMHRQDKNYEEAIKCYKNALKIDKDNFQILRDMALLQLQCRQLEGAIDTRRKIIFTRPSSPFNWISLVVIHHLSGNLQQAIEILDIYLEIFGKIKDTAEHHRFYRVSILMEMGKYEEVIEYMQSSFKKQNTLRYYEALAGAYYSAKKYSLCEETVWKLIDINPDCREYIVQMFDLYAAQNKEVAPVFDAIREKSLLAGVEMLSIVDDEIFCSRAPSVFKSILERGSPATFQLFKDVLRREDRREIIWETLLQLNQEDLSVIIFKAKYLVLVEDYSNALSLIESAIACNAANTDLVLIKAHIQKRMGLSSAAANDTMLKIKDSVANDKFSVSKMAKYLIRYGSISEAQEMMGKFIQKPNQQERMADLHEMQAVWYLIEMADRQFKDGNNLSAACFYRKIELVFVELNDDQLDFHGYALRRMSFIEYMRFLRFLDGELKTSEVLKRAHIGLCRCLLNMTSESGELDSLAKQLDSANLSSQFSDDLSALSEYIRSLLSSPKSTSDYLHRICNTLIQTHPEDTDVIQTVLDVALKFDMKLCAQKLVIKLLEKGVNVSDNVIESINKKRLEPDSLWQHVPLLN